MRDPYLLLITALICFPGKPLKFYMDMSGKSRGTFFKVKADLVALGIARQDDRKKLIVDREKAQHFLEEAYPGLTIDLGALPQSTAGSLNRAPTKNTQTSAAV